MPRAQPSGKRADNGSGSGGQSERAEQKQARSEHLANDEPDGNQRPDEPAHNAL